VLGKRLWIVVLAGVTCGWSTAFGQSFFTLTAQTTGATPQSVVIADNHLLDLTFDLVNSKNGFSSIAGQPYTAGLTWGGVKNAMVFTGNSTGTTVTVTIPQTGFSQTFTGATSQAVQTQIKQFIERDGETTIAAFNKSIDQESPLAVIAGNPQAMTEIYSMDAFNRYGMDPTFGFMPKSKGDGLQIGADFNGGRASTTAGSESYAAADIFGGIRFSSNFGLSWAIPMEFRNNDGAATYMLGFQLGAPITILPDNGNNGVFWEITPWGTVESGYSPDLAVGGLVGGGGGTSSLNLRTGNWVWTLADQWSYQTGLPFHYNDYHFDTSANQEITTNGGKVTYNFGPGYFIDGGAAYTDVLSTARVTDYITITAGMGAHVGTNSGFRVSYDGDYGHRYRDFGGTIDAWWSF
jgi:hypothetical protein